MVSSTIGICKPTVRPESKYAQKFSQNSFRNSLKFLPIMLLFPLCLQCAPGLATFLKTILEHFNRECSIGVFHYKVTVLLESIGHRSYVQCG